MQQQFGLEQLANGNYVLRYRGNEVKEPWNGPNQYIVLGADGKLAIGAATQGEAAQFAKEVLTSGTAAAVAAARKADTAVVVVGSMPFINGREDSDRPGTALAAGQQAIVKAVTEANPRTVVVLESSYPLTGSWSQASAVLWTSHAGQETGRALADVLFGDFSPSGRLPQTWYRTDAELPDPLDFDVIKAGWTYQYHRAEPLYPFGHGLTYGKFRYSALRVNTPVVAANGRLNVSVDVTNTSRTASDEVVQLYTAQHTSRVAQPIKTLRAFQRLAFAPGQRRTVSFEVKASDLAFWDVTRNKWVVESALQDVQVGSSSADIRARTTVAVRGEVIPPRDLSKPTMATDFDDYSGIELIDAAKVRGDAVGKTAAGDWISFQQVQLGRGATRLEASVSRSSQGTGKVEIRLGSPTGPLAGTLTVPATADRYSWAVTTTRLDPRLARGVRDVYLVFTSPGTNLRDLTVK